MEEQVIVVPALSIYVVTGETCYSSEGGFSAHYAETSPEKPDLQKQLTTAHQQKAGITLRCAMLDAIGIISRVKTEDNPATFVLSINDIVYRNPKRNRN